MAGCGCHHVATTETQRKILIIALILNAMMFIVGFTSGILAHSTSLLADSLDMLADAFAYSLGLLAIERSKQFKAAIAKCSSGLLLLLGSGVLLDAGYRAWLGHLPKSSAMITITCLSLIVNITVLMLLNPFRQSEIYLRASWTCTRSDVIANLGVIISALLVLFTHSRYPDLIIGFIIGIYVIKSAIEIFRQSLQTA